MAAVSSTLKLVDKMSPVMRQIVKSMEMTLNVMGQLDKSAYGADFSQNFGLARHEIQNTIRALDQMDNEIANTSKKQEQFNEEARESSTAIDKAINSQQKLNDKVREGKSAAGGLSMMFMGINSAIQIAQQAWDGLEKFTNFADEIVLTSSRLNLIDDTEVSDITSAVTMTVRESGLNETEQKIIDSANRSGAAYTETAAAVSKLGILAGQAFGSKDEIIAFSELMNKSFAVGGADIQEQAAAIHQLTQAMAAGKLQGDEYRSITENAPLLAKAIEGYMRNVQGMEGSLKKWSSDGLLSAEIVKNAMFWAADEIQSKYGALLETWGRSMNTFKNDMIAILMPTIAKFSAMVNSPQFQLMMAVAAQTLGVLVAAVTTALDMIGAVINTVASIILGNIDLIAVLLGGLIISMLPVLIGWLWGVVAAGIAAAATWIMANLPLIAMILIVSLLISQMKQFGVTTEDVTSFVGEVFGWLYGVIYNIIADLWNFIAVFAEFFANVFNDPIGSIGRLFFGLLDTILGIVETAANAIDAVLGSNLAGAVSGFRKDMNDWVEETIGPAKVTVERMEKLDVSDTMMKGAEMGKNLATFADDFLNGTTNLLGDTGTGFDYSGMYDPAVTVGGGKLDSVGKIDDDVTISEEDIKLLKDIASMDYQLHYTQLTPNFKTGDFYINEKADWEEGLGMIEAWASEALQSSLVVN